MSDFMSDFSNCKITRANMPVVGICHSLCVAKARSNFVTTIESFTVLYLIYLHSCCSFSGSIVFIK